MKIRYAQVKAGDRLDMKTDDKRKVQGNVVTACGPNKYNVYCLDLDTQDSFFGYGDRTVERVEDNA